MKPLHRSLAISPFVILLASTIVNGDDVNQLMINAQRAAQTGDSADAVKFATQALAVNSKLAGAYYLRGREQFRLGNIDESVADLDKYVELEPRIEPRMWERGISYYYAGKFKQGAEQFALYQTYHDNDVENSVWRYLCVVPTDGVEVARKNMLPIKNDPRVPMMEIYEMYRGNLKPDDVLAEAKADEPLKDQLNRRLFYAHLYIGLFHEANGDAELARKHIDLADQHKIGHYMWDVAHVHAARLNKGKEDRLGFELRLRARFPFGER